MDGIRGPVALAIRKAASVAELPVDAGCPRLGVDTLPPRIDALSPGMLYAVVCEQQAVRLPLAAAALAASLRERRPCFLVTPSDPAMLLRKARLAGFPLGENAGRGELVVLHLASDPGKHIFRAGPGAFPQAFEQNCEARKAFIVVDQADALFMLADPRASSEAARTYLDWLREREHTLLALFAPSPLAAREYLNLRLAAENFAGFALARASEGGGTLEIRHWFTAAGTSPRESFALRLHTRGAPQLASASPAEEELPPGEAVIYVRDALLAPEPNWDAWQPADSLEEAVLAARRSECATVLLAFRGGKDFPQLCRAVSRVRASSGASLRLLVREREARLRGLQMLALLRLGVSSILPADLPDSSVKRIVDLLQGTRFTRPYESDVAALERELQSFANPAPGAQSFCEAVEGLLAAADGLDLPSALIRVDAEGADSGKLAALARRALRDVVALAQPERVWLFLFGCAVGGIPAAIGRLQAQAKPGRTLSWVAEDDLEGIAAALESLRRQ